MLYFSEILIIILTIILIICSIVIIKCIKFQNKQKKKYDECLNLLKEKDKQPLISDDIIGIDGESATKLMMKLYDTYICFVDRLNNNEKKFENILDEFMKELYENKIDIYISKDRYEITEKIQLIGYSLVEYSINRLEFRIKINCLNYLLEKDKIISGSNLNKIEQVILLTYINQDEKWLINNIDKVYEKKLGK